MLTRAALLWAVLVAATVLVPVAGGDALNGLPLTSATDLGWMILTGTGLFALSAALAGRRFRWILALALAALGARVGAAGCEAGQGLELQVRYQSSRDGWVDARHEFGYRARRIDHAGVVEGVGRRPLPVSFLNHTRYGPETSARLARGLELRWTGWIVPDTSGPLALVGTAVESTCVPTTVRAGEATRIDARARFGSIGEARVRLTIGTGGATVPDTWLWRHRPSGLWRTGPWLRAIGWLLTLGVLGWVGVIAWREREALRGQIGRRWLGAGGLVLAALVAGTVLWELKTQRGPEHSVLGPGDYLFYETCARELVTHGAWEDDGIPFHRSAPMRYYLAVLHAIGGDGVFGVVLLQCVALGLAAFLTALLWIELTGRHRSAWLPAMIALLLPKQLAYGLRFYPTAVATLLLVALAWTLVRALRADRSRTRWLIAAGTVAGLLALFRPHAVVLAVALPMWFLVRRRPWRQTLALALPLVAMLALVPVRNRVVAGTWTLLPTFGPVNLIAGNNLPRSVDVDTVSAGTPERTRRFRDGARRLLEFEENPDRTFDPFEADENLEMHGPLTALFGRYMASHPGHFLGQLARKMFRFAFPLKYPLVILIVVLALAGGWRLYREGALAPWGPVWLLVVGYAAPLIVALFHHRHRSPLLPLLLLPACYGGVRIIEAVRGRAERGGAERV